MHLAICAHNTDTFHCTFTSGELRVCSISCVGLHFIYTLGVEKKNCCRGETSTKAKNSLFELKWKCPRHAQHTTTLQVTTHELTDRKTSRCSYTLPVSPPAIYFRWNALIEKKRNFVNQMPGFSRIWEGLIVLCPKPSETGHFLTFCEFKSFCFNDLSECTVCLFIIIVNLVVYDDKH